MGWANLVAEGASWNLTYCGLCAGVMSECKAKESKNQSFHFSEAHRSSCSFPLRFALLYLSQPSAGKKLHSPLSREEGVRTPLIGWVMFWGAQIFSSWPQERREQPGTYHSRPLSHRSHNCVPWGRSVKISVYTSQALPTGPQGPPALSWRLFRLYTPPGFSPEKDSQGLN